MSYTSMAPHMWRPGDPEVHDFDVVIVDEVHERHLVVDFVLGILREVVRNRRQDLKLVLMSATLQKD